MLKMRVPLRVGRTGRPAQEIESIEMIAWIDTSSYCP